MIRIYTVGYDATEIARIIEDMIAQLDPSGTRDFDVTLRELNNGLISVTVEAGSVAEEDMDSFIPAAAIPEHPLFHATLH